MLTSYSHLDFMEYPTDLTKTIGLVFKDMIYLIYYVCRSEMMSVLVRYFQIQNRRIKVYSSLHNLSMFFFKLSITSLSPLEVYSTHSLTDFLLTVRQLLLLLEKNKILNYIVFMRSSNFFCFSMKQSAKRSALLLFLLKQVSMTVPILLLLISSRDCSWLAELFMTVWMTSLTLGSILDQNQQWYNQVNRCILQINQRVFDVSCCLLQMSNFIYFILYRLLTLIYQFTLTLENLFNGFIRFIYIPLFHSNFNNHKIIEDLSRLEKKPVEEITFVYQIRYFTNIQLKRAAVKIIKNAMIMRQAVHPRQLNCYIETSTLSSESELDLMQIIEDYQGDKKIKMNILTLKDNKYQSVIKIQKSKATPLVIVYSTYPTVLGLHPQHLVGAEIAFRPNILKSTEYDLYSSLQAYAQSEQRKGK